MDERIACIREEDFPTGFSNNNPPPMKGNYQGAGSSPASGSHQGKRLHGDTLRRWFAQILGTSLSGKTGLDIIAGMRGRHPPLGVYNCKKSGME